jgi:hypothetical protein
MRQKPDTGNQEDEKSAQLIVDDLLRHDTTFERITNKTDNFNKIKMIYSIFHE